MDVAVERMFRELIAERFPDHQVLAEEMGGSATVPAGPVLGVRSDRRHDQLRARPADLLRVARARDRRRRAGGGGLRSEPEELFTAERGGGAFLNGRPLRVSAAATLVDAMLVTGFPYDVHTRVDEIVGLFGAFVGRARAVRRLGSAAIDLCYVAAGRLDGFWESDLKPWDIAGGSLIVSEAGGRVTTMDGAAFTSRGRHVLATNGLIHDAMLDVIHDFPPSPCFPNRTTVIPE